jgi:hypothetical protein
MWAFSLGFVHSLITKWDKGVRNKRVVKTKTVRSWWNG